MIFSSFEFILFFLPFVVTCYFLIARHNRNYGLWFLAVASLTFYGWWNPAYLGLIAGSIAINYALARGIIHYYKQRAKAKPLLIAGICFNIGLLVFYKYTDFLIANYTIITGTQHALMNIVLPLGISFFTFQQTSYLIDAYREARTEMYSIRDYILFITFFPHLIAGPLVYHKEMMPQFSKKAENKWQWNNAWTGLVVFIIGLFKKIVIADNLAIFASWGFDQAHALTMVEAWIATLCYTFQIYFDFSGYSDMAIGAGLLFNIRLPENFNSPYKSKNLQDFWRRWHMTLGRFLREYLYIPLGGNRHGMTRQMAAVFVTFLLGGLWHGASWNFVIWGAMHGIGLVLYEVWKKIGRPLPKIPALLLTFLYVHIAWVFFRAVHFDHAVNMLYALVDIDNAGISRQSFLYPPYTLAFLLLALAGICLFAPNSRVLSEKAKPNLAWIAMLITIGLVAFSRIGGYSEFLYFQF